MAFTNYLEDENDKPYFTTNSLAYYYDKMEGFAKAVEGSAKALNLTKEEIEQRIALRLAEWDKNLESFDGSVENLLTEWVDDGTLTHVIDSTLIDQRIAPVALQLEDMVNRSVTFEAFGAVGDGIIYDTVAIQQAINYASQNNLSIDCPKNKKYRIKKVGEVTYVLGSSSNKSGYSIVIPSNTKINFNGSKMLLDDNVYCSFFTNEGVFNTPKTLNENISLNDLHFEGKLEGVTYIDTTYNPCINFVKVKNVSIVNPKIENVFDCAIRVLIGENLYLDKVVVNNTRGNGVYLGLHNHPLEDLRVKNSYIGTINCYNISEGKVGSSCNPVIATLKDTNITLISAVNSAMGFKIQDQSENVNINSVFFDGGLLSTVNSGLKIQGLSDVDLLNRINVGNIISKNCGGSGLYIQYAKNVNIGNYSGFNNGVLGSASDVWIHKEDITITTININNARSSGVQLREGSKNVTINNIFCKNVLGNAIIDSSESAVINNVVIDGDDDNFVTSKIYSNQLNTSNTTIDRVLYKASNGTPSTSLTILSPYVKIREYLLVPNEKIDFVMTLSAGTKTDIMNSNILNTSNGVGGFSRPYVYVTQISGAKIDITNQTYITGGYRLTHGTTPLGTEQILVSIRNVHI